MHRRLVVTGLAATSATSMLPNSPSRAALASWRDGFNSFNGTLWVKSSGYANGGAFNCGWRADHVKINDGKLVLLLDDVPSSGKLYSSGEVQTRDTAHYGSYRVKMKPAKGSGLVSSFFTYADSGNAEIDVEFLGKNTAKLHCTCWKDGISSEEAVISLGFDAASAYHEYGFDWTPGSITWFVDGRPVHTKTGAVVPTEPSPIYVNLWCVNAQASAWAGTFIYSRAKKALYDYVSFEVA